MLLTLKNYLSNKDRGNTKMKGDKLVLGLTGMPGSGKSLVVNVAKEQDYDIVTMGDIIREETKKRDLELTRENVGKVMLALRREEGPAVVAKRCLPKLTKSKSSKIIVDGIRSLDEIDEFKRNLKKFTHIGVHASPETRFQRLFNRARPDDPKNWEDFNERDMRELSVGLGNAITMAEKMIINEGPINAVKIDIREALEAVEQEWMT
jgi:dephospho-CoA kinase